MNDNERSNELAMGPLAPDSYAQFLADLKSRIHAAQIRASLAINRELVLLYWRVRRARAAIQHCWSRAVLVHQIESGLHDPIARLMRRVIIEGSSIYPIEEEYSWNRERNASRGVRCGKRQA